MNSAVSLGCRAFAIVITCFLIGIASNLIPARHIPWLYIPPKEITISNHRILFVDSKQAEKWLSDPLTIFVDTRSEKDYIKGHVRGAVSLPSDDKEEKFPAIEPLMPEGSRLILYCHGPDCDMAERVVAFLINFGYSNIMIMNDGYPAWEQNGFPTEKSSDHQ